MKILIGIRDECLINFMKSDNKNYISYPNYFPKNDRVSLLNLDSSRKSASNRVSAFWRAIFLTSQRTDTGTDIYSDDTVCSPQSSFRTCSLYVSFGFFFRHFGLFLRLTK